MASATEVAALERAGRLVLPGFRLRVLAATGSTQDVARSAARAGAEAGFSCVAGMQRAGRGRGDRAWSAPAGSALLCSVLLRISHRCLTGMPIAAGMAMRAAIATSCGYQSRLKWPNDLLAGDRKLAGVLCEVEPRAPGHDIAVVVGVGVNLRVPSFPPSIAGVSLHELVPDPPTALALFGVFLGELVPLLDTLQSDGIGGLRGQWMAHAAGLGEQVTARSGSGDVTGVAMGIDDDGALILRTATGPVRVLAGDVHLGLAPLP